MPRRGTRNLKNKIDLSEIGRPLCISDNYIYSACYEENIRHWSIRDPFPRIAVIITKSRNDASLRVLRRDYKFELTKLEFLRSHPSRGMEKEKKKRETRKEKKEKENITRRCGVQKGAREKERKRERWWEKNRGCACLRIEEGRRQTAEAWGRRGE